MKLLIICPESLADAANNLARAIGNEGDQYSFRAQWTKGGDLYRVCNFGVVPERLSGWRAAPSIPDELPDGVDRAKCETALAAMVAGDIELIDHDGNAVEILTSNGYSVVEEEV